MKKILLIFGVLAFTFTSCGDKKKEEVKKEVELIKVEETIKAAEENTSDAKNEQVILGEKLFSEKTCVACHVLDTKLIGPSIKEIIRFTMKKVLIWFNF